ncbi:MAG: hypothetical protein H7172_06590 [Ferruginibacter sp.]|nr:hypothetical protein [Rhodoferax sp.]
MIMSISRFFDVSIKDDVMWRRWCKLIFLISGFSVLPKIIVVVIFETFPSNNNEGVDVNFFNFMNVFFALIVSPLTETLYHQSIFSWMDEKYKNKYRGVFLWISVLFFTVSHWGQSFESLCWIFWVGLIFQYSYFELVDRRIDAYWIISISHSFVNFSTFVFAFYFLHKN